MRVVHMTIDILCTDLCDVWAKYVGTMYKNMFCKHRPHGGAITGLSLKFQVEVHCWHSKSICTQFRSNWNSGIGD